MLHTVSIPKLCGNPEELRTAAFVQATVIYLLVLFNATGISI